MQKPVLSQEEILSQIAQRLRVCEYSGLDKVKDRSGKGGKKVFIGEFSEKSCMPTKVSSQEGSPDLVEGEYTIIVSTNGGYEGFFFILRNEKFKFSANFNSEDHNKILNELKFVPVTPIILKKRGQVRTGKFPLDVEGLLPFQPSEDTVQLPLWRYCMVKTAAGNQSGLVMRKWDGNYYFLPGSDLRDVVKKLEDHGFLAYKKEEK